MSLHGRIKSTSSRPGLTRSAPWTLWYVGSSVGCACMMVHYSQVANAGVNEMGEYFTPKIKNGQLQKPTMATVDVNLSGSIYSKSDPTSHKCGSGLIGVCFSCSLSHPLFGTRTKTRRYAQIDSPYRFDGYVLDCFRWLNLISDIWTASWQAAANAPMYSATKSGVLALGRSLAHPLAQKKIRVAVIHPFFTGT